MQLRCSKCAEIKPTTEFYTNRRDTRGYSYNCKDCEKAKKKVDYSKHTEKRLSYRRKYLYGLSEEEYQDMLFKSGGNCEICGGTCKTGRALAVDHCHTTGKVRGLLCTRCNNAIGNFEDNVSILKAAITYLERTN